MKSSKSLIVTLVVLIIMGALYRIIPNRPLGFAPQIAMALFGGAMIKDKKWAFALPVFSMFLSDLLYQSFSTTPGFYEGQWFNYCLFAGITLLGFTLKKVTVLRVAGYSVLGTGLYFLLSNGYYWLAGGTDIRTNLLLDRSLAGLMQSYAQGLPFLRGALIATVVFSAILFGGYYLLTNKSHKASPVQA